MGRAKFKPHASLCDVWLIWCILAHHLKAFWFSQVFGRREEMWGIWRRTQTETDIALWHSQQPPVETVSWGTKGWKNCEACVPIKLQSVSKTFTFVMSYTMNLMCVIVAQETGDSLPSTEAWTLNIHRACNNTSGREAGGALCVHLDVQVHARRLIKKRKETSNFIIKHHFILLVC